MHIKELAVEMHRINKAKGYYEGNINIPEKLALIHSEVSEALEAHRINGAVSILPDGDLGELMGIGNDAEFKEGYKKHVKGSFEEEMADIVLRTLSLCEHMGINIEAHLALKVRYNNGGEIKKY